MLTQPPLVRTGPLPESTPGLTGWRARVVAETVCEIGRSAGLRNWFRPTVVAERRVDVGANDKERCHMRLWNPSWAAITLGLIWNLGCQSSDMTCMLPLSQQCGAALSTSCWTQPLADFI